MKKYLSLLKESKRKVLQESFIKSVQNISYFNKDKTFIIRAIQSIGGIKYYWPKNADTNRKLLKRFLRTELFAQKSNFFS